jgi:hypothetical protein
MRGAHSGSLAGFTAGGASEETAVEIAIENILRPGFGKGKGGLVFLPAGNYTYFLGRFTSFSLAPTVKLHG